MYGLNIQLIIEWCIVIIYNITGINYFIDF